MQWHPWHPPSHTPTTPHTVTPPSHTPAPPACSDTPITPPPPPVTPLSHSPAPGDIPIRPPAHRDTPAVGQQPLPAPACPAPARGVRQEASARGGCAAPLLGYKTKAAGAAGRGQRPGAGGTAGPLQPAKVCGGIRARPPTPGPCSGNVPARGEATASLSKKNLSNMGDGGWDWSDHPPTSPSSPPPRTPGSRMVPGAGTPLGERLNIKPSHRRGDRRQPLPSRRHQPAQSLHGAGWGQGGNGVSDQWGQGGSLRTSPIPDVFQVAGLPHRRAKVGSCSK